MSGSAKYLNESKKKVNSSSMTVIFRMQTIEKEIQLRRMKNCIDFDVLEEENQNATHVVTAIAYGANGLVTAKYEYSNDEHERTIQGSLNAKFDKLSQALADVKDVNESEYKGDSKGEDVKFEYNWKCDVGNNDGGMDIPIDFEGAIENMRKLPKLVADSGDYDYTKNETQKYDLGA